LKMPSEENAVNGGEGTPRPYLTTAELRLAALIIDVTREMKRDVPAPRAAPYFGLDDDVSYDLGVLESLSSPGIFRKYELVLLVRSGLGGMARWLSRRLGCRILGVDADAARTRAARKLNDAAGMGTDVHFAAGTLQQLPFRDRVFTHVWMIDPISSDRSSPALREAFRVLRGGAHFAMQVSAADDVKGLQDVLARVGFVDFRVSAAPIAPRNHAANSARGRLQAATTDRDVLRALDARNSTPTSSGQQIFCRRP
jgi:SAM-dependent methyltransferase